MQMNYGFTKKEVNFTEEPALLQCKEAFEIVTKTIIEGSFTNLRGHESRIYSRILSKLDESSDVTINIEQAEIDFLKKIFLGDEIKIHPNHVRLHSLYANRIEELR